MTFPHSFLSSLFPLPRSRANRAQRNRRGPRPLVPRSNQFTRQSVVEILEKRTLLSGAAAFTAPVEFDTGSNPLSMAVADFNGDGKLDMVSANYSGSVSILLGNGNGTFQAQQSFAAGPLPYAVAVADFNGDGKADVVVTNPGSGNVSMLLGNGDGTLQTCQTFAAGGTYPFAAAVADFNGDGKADLVVTNGGAIGSVGVLLGNGDGTLQTCQTHALGLNPQLVAVADFNGDGKADVAAVGYGASVLLGNGDGTFQAEQYDDAAAGDTFSMAVGDFNGDGKPDLVVGNFDFYTNDYISARVLLGNGDGTFQPEHDVLGYQTFIFSVAVGDFNADGKADLALAFSGVTVHTGNGDGTFQNFALPVGYQAGELRAVAVGDFNGDGGLDLAFVDQLDNKLGVMLNISPQQQAQNLSQQVQALITAGTLKQAQANSLLVKLTNVLNSGGSGRIGAFINEVEALIKSRRLSAADGESLISLADVLLGSLS